MRMIVVVVAVPMGMPIVSVLVTPMPGTISHGTIGFGTMCRFALVAPAAMARMRMVCAHAAEIKPAGVHYKHALHEAAIGQRLGSDWFLPAGTSNRVYAFVRRAWKGLCEYL